LRQREDLLTGPSALFDFARWKRFPQRKAELGGRDRLVGGSIRLVS